MVEQLKRKARLMDVPLDKMRVREEVSQRKFDPNWANTIAQDFNLEDFGAPYVNRSGEWFWIVDGQHRVAALKLWLGEWKGQKVECWVYQNLSEQEEADLFDRLNTVKRVSAFDTYKIRLTAGRETETNIEAIVRLKKLKVSRQKGEGSIACPGTLAKVYRRGADCLSRDLGIAYEAFGDGGLDSDILDGLGLLISRYDGRIDDKRAIRTLGSVRGGVNALRNRAERLRQQMGAQRTHCIAAAAVEAYNRGKGGKKIASWWKETQV
jgi:hypothetical protein